MEQLLAIGDKYNIPVIEDSAEAIGSIYNSKRAGSMGNFGVFSFHGTKTVTTGEGGIFVTNDDELHSQVLTLSNHGRSTSQVKQFWPDMVGFKYKISNIQAAIGCAQMERIEKLIARKREIFTYYKQRLECIENVFMNPEPEGIINGFWMPTVVFGKKTGITREKLQHIFAEENIDARVFFWPLSSFDMFEEVLKNQVAWSLPKNSINLPSYHDITEDELFRTSSVIEKLYQDQGRY